MRYLIGLLAIAAGTTASAQQYMIKYDLNSFKSNYYKIDGDTTKVRNVNLKKNGRVILKVENFNPFYWNAKVTSYKTPVQEEAGFANAFNPISAIAQGFGSLMNGIPLLDLPNAKGNGTDANSRFLNTAAAYADNYKKVQEISEKSDELQLVKLQLQELKFDFSKTETQIKTEAKELVRSSLGTDSLNLLNAVNIGKQYTVELNTSLDEMSRLNAQLQQQLPTVNGESRVEGKTFNEIAQKTANSMSVASKMIVAQQKDPNFLVEEVVDISNLYREISNASFQFTYAINSEPDLSHLKLELYPKVGDKAKDTMVQFFQLNGKKALKVRNSVGAAFTYFTANNTNYFIGADSVIRKSGKDLFNPLISTFVHFYSGRMAGIKLGGAFGIGIPLTGEKKDINFLLGLTTAFGQNEPILLSFGVSGAKVNKLTNGYEVGQKVKETSADKLVSSGYDIGGFVSVSFNLSNLGKK